MLSSKILAILLVLVIGGYAKPSQPIGREIKANEVVFIGDSLTEYWQDQGKDTWAEFYVPLGAKNTGVGGDLTTDTIQRINRGSIDNLNARVAVLLIGSNDLTWGGRKEEYVYENVGIILNMIRVKNPGCKIILLSSLPINDPEIHQKFLNLEALINQYENNEDIFFLSMGHKFSTGLGQIIRSLYYIDGAHLSAAGYKVWAEEMNPLFFRLLDDPATGPPLPSSTPRPAPSTTPKVPGSGVVVFLGDFVSEFWSREGLPTWDKHYAPLGAVNLGVAGETTGSLLRKIKEEGLIDTLNPEVVVVSIGTNDLTRGVFIVDILGNTIRVLNAIRDSNPGVKILLHGILPRNSAIAHELGIFMNGHMGTFSKSEDIWYVEMRNTFSSGVGNLFPELYLGNGLHLSELGYERLAGRMNPTLFNILDKIREEKQRKAGIKF